VGQGVNKPELVYPAKEKKCVESKEYMRTYHMDLLNDWRDLYVRENDRFHTSPDGVKYKRSLSDTCLKCHANVDQFCDRCHNYVGVSPYCWTCHIQPKDVK
jgi:hypothetical protein